MGQVTGFACPPRCSPVVFTIAFSPAGHSVYLGGHFGLVNDVARNEAAAVPLSDGSAVLPFNPNIYAPANCAGCTTPETSRVYHMIVTSSRVYTCGGYWRVNGSRRSFNVSAFNPDTGALDPSFTVQDDGDTPGCALRAGILYVGGHFNIAGPGCQPNQLDMCVTRHHVAAIDTEANTRPPVEPGRELEPRPARHRGRDPAGRVRRLHDADGRHRPAGPGRVQGAPPAVSGVYDRMAR